MTSSLKTTILGLLTLAFIPYINAAASKEKPNIIWIMADDLGYGDLGCYGSPDIPTPHIDNLASKGLKFTSFYAAASTCSPSRASILSGLYPESLGIGGALMGKGGMPGETITIAEMLKQSGYVTGLVGKWHLGYEGEMLPNQQGFDEFYGHRGGKIDFFAHTDTAQKAPGSKMGKHDFYDNEKEIFPEGYATDLFTDRAIQFMDKHKETPFFLFLSYNAPHYARPGVLQAPEEYIKKFAKGTKTTNRELYAAMVSCMDDGIGKVLANLESHGLTKNTLVVFVSDNGADPSNGGSNKPFMGGKWKFDEGGIRVPMIIQWPATFAGGKTSDEVVHIFDLFPSILAASNITKPDDLKLNGINVLENLKSGTPLPERTLYFGKETVRKGHWKLLGDRLFDLDKDPTEQNDVATQFPAVVDELKLLLKNRK